jgi:hypothetical protein
MVWGLYEHVTYSREKKLHDNYIQNYKPNNYMLMQKNLG